MSEWLWAVIELIDSFNNDQGVVFDLGDSARENQRYRGGISGVKFELGY